MLTKIFFTDKTLILTDTPTATEGVVRLPSSELSKANVLKLLETADTIEVCDPGNEKLSRDLWYAEDRISDLESKLDKLTDRL